MSRRGRSLILLAACLGQIATACAGGQREPPSPGLALVRLAEVPADGAIYSVTHHAYVADSEETGLIAFSARDPRNGCRLAHVAQEEEGWGLDLEPGTRFFDPCHGSQYDLAGRFLAGPGAADLTRIDIEVVGEVVYIELQQPEDA